jgi:hypothetical protein
MKIEGGNEEEKKFLCCLSPDNVHHLDIVPRLSERSGTDASPFGNRAILGKGKQFAISGLFL